MQSNGDVSVHFRYFCDSLCCLRRGLKMFICVPVEVGEFSITRFVAARYLPQTRKPYGFA